jgi:ADP-ribose pyrophosphatase YjhB (NUDIX family)
LGGQHFWDEAWNAYLAEGDAKQARKRVSVDVLLRDQRGRILLVDPQYKPDWNIPGGHGGDERTAAGCCTTRA